VTRFTVEAVYKGEMDAGSDVSIHHETQGSACGLRFPEGVTFTVFAYESEGALWANLCWATNRGQIPAHELGLPRLGEVIPAPPEAVGWSSDTGRLLWIVGLSLGVATVSVAVGVKLRGQRRESSPPPSV
jgi:hypothetical protein